VRVDDAFCVARAQLLQLMLLQLALMLALVMLALVLMLMVLVDMIQRRLARTTRRGGG